MNSPNYGKKYMWCQHRGPNNGKYGKHTDMYMLAPNNHAEWLADNNDKAKSWKDQKKEKKATTNKKTVYFETASNTDSNTEKRGKNDKLALVNSFKSALVTMVQLSDPEVQYIWILIWIMPTNILMITLTMNQNNRSGTDG